MAIKLWLQEEQSRAKKCARYLTSDKNRFCETFGKEN